MMSAPKKVAILGSGSIGIAFAIVFARSNYKVVIWDKFPEALNRAKSECDQKISLLEKHGLCNKDKISENIDFEADLLKTLDGAFIVQEAVPELLEIKLELFKEVAVKTASTVPILSSTSALQPSQLNAAAPERILVGHPGNPPFLIPVIEIVPSKQTSPGIISQVKSFYVSVGMKPVLVGKEIGGFIFNRLQGAVLREAYCLVRDGVASVEDIDIVIKFGLGRRWSIMGPFETSDLNTRGGIESHAAKMGPAYYQMGQERGQDDPWTPEMVEQVTNSRRTTLPLDHWEERVKWRDESLLQLLPIWNELLK
jgi:3-hydroxyacyl-CoA dehydrogenase